MPSMNVSTPIRLPFSPSETNASSPGKLRTTHAKLSRHAPYASINRGNSCGELDASPDVGGPNKLVAFTKTADSPSGLNLQVDQIHGVIVSGIDRAEEAARSGLLVGDRILAIDGIPIRSDASAFKHLDGANEGQQVAITVADSMRTVMLDKTTGRLLGLSIKDAPSSSRGVLIHSIEGGSLADTAALCAGDTIFSVNEQLVHTHDQAVARMDAAKGEVRLVVSGGRARRQQGSFKYMAASFVAGPCGMTLKPDTDGAVRVKALDEGSQAVELGVQPGSVVLAIGGASVSGLSHAAQIDLMRKAARPMQVLFTVYSTDDDLQEASGL